MTARERFDSRGSGRCGSQERSLPRSGPTAAPCSAPDTRPRQLWNSVPGTFIGRWDRLTTRSAERRIAAAEVVGMTSPPGVSGALAVSSTAWIQRLSVRGSFQARQVRHLVPLRSVHPPVVRHLGSSGPGPDRRRLRSCDGDAGLDSVVRERVHRVSVHCLGVRRRHHLRIHALVLRQLEHSHHRGRGAQLIKDSVAWSRSASCAARRRP